MERKWKFIERSTAAEVPGDVRRAQLRARASAARSLILSSIEDLLRNGASPDMRMLLLRLRENMSRN